MSGNTRAAKLESWRARLAAVLLVATLAPALASAQTAGGGFHVQVFALSGPACGGPVILGEDCPDVLLPGAELVLQRRDRWSGTWEDVAVFTTNTSGYASLVVNRRGFYRVDVPENDPDGIQPMPLPFFEGPVYFQVPARHRAANGRLLTPVVVNFDSGIR